MDVIQSYQPLLRQAHSVYNVANRTDLMPAHRLSSHLGNRLFFKREDTQPTFSFKCRGAYAKIAALSEAEKQSGIITASAGNHAQGVALACQKQGLSAYIVMPETTPSIKVQSVQDLGGQAILHGDDYDTAYQHALYLANQHRYTYVHPYDDPMVIAGQGTIGLEIMDQIDMATVDGLFVPVGGGGLIAGVIVAIKHRYPGVRIIGVESEESACLHAALAHGHRVALDSVGIFADGVAVKQIGEAPYRIIREHVDHVITVSVDEICAGIKDNFEETRVLVEPAGALSLAGIKRYIQTHHTQNQTFVGITCGANTNFDRLRHIAERTEIGEKTESILGVTIPEQPGSFLSFCEAIGKRVVTEFNYRYSHNERAQVFVGVRTRQAEAIIDPLTASGYTVVNLTDNEAAKLHIRYMIGGQTALPHERLFRFRFPEKPGALLKFLAHLGSQWTITLFHYRNHGAAYGRVLVGLAATPTDTQLDETLATLGYWFQEESDNPAYTLFLKPFYLKDTKRN
jgi:threonine dehydratase